MKHSSPARVDPDRIRIEFDDPNLIAGAGLILPMTLARRLGVGPLVDECLNLPTVAGRANAGEKVQTLVASALRGGDCIAHADMLRAGEAGRLLGFKPKSASIAGSFLRSFTWGNVRQLDRVGRILLQRSRELGAGPGAGPLTIDLDSTICQTYGFKNQGGDRCYGGERGYHPLLAVAAGSGQVLHARLRRGSANPGRGAGHFAAETFARMSDAGCRGPVLVRADSGFYTRKVARAARKAGARFSISARLRKGMLSRIWQIPEEWTPIPGWPDGGAWVAETSYRAFGLEDSLRLIVRRTTPTPGTQLAAIADYQYHPFVSDREGAMLELEADHRRHAEIEGAIRDLKYGVGLNHLPSGKFAANAAWLWIQVLAHNLGRWLLRLPGDAGPGDRDRGEGPAEAASRRDPGTDRVRLPTTATLRRRLFALPGRLTRSGRVTTLHLPINWPWAGRFLAMLDRVRRLPIPT